MGKRKKPQTGQGTPVVIENEGGLDVVRSYEGKEIRYTKDYGLGADVHSRFIEVNVLVKNNLSVFEYRRSFGTDWNSVNKAKSWIVAMLTEHAKPPVDLSAGLHYTIESTSSYHQILVTAWGGFPSIVNPTLARAGKKKTDIIDAQTLALSDLTGVWPTSYIPRIEAVELRMLVDERRYCIHNATRISNRINNSLLRLGINVSNDGSVSKNSELRDRIEDLLGGAKPQSDDDTIPAPPSIPDDVRCIFKADYEEYDRFRKSADEYFDRILEKIYSMKWETGDGEISGEEMMKLLTSAPGIGNQTAVLWLSRVITPRRFPNAKALAAYCGCDPSVKVSAGKVTSTVKRGGRTDLHSALCMAASNLMRRHSEPFGMFGYNIAMQTGVWKKGVSALARKLAVAMYYMALYNKPFSYESYTMITEPDVMNISIECLVKLNPSFKRYMRHLISNNITDTKQLVHKYYICELTGMKGLGKNFFALTKDFISDQKKYKKLLEEMTTDENCNA